MAEYKIPGPNSSSEDAYDIDPEAGTLGTIVEGPRPPAGLFISFVVALAFGCGCDKIFPFPVRKADGYQCDASVTVQNVSPLKCEDYIVVTSTHTKPPAFVVFSNSVPGVIPKLYLDPIAYVPTADGIPAAVKGTCLVRLAYEERTSKASPYLTLSFTSPIETVYIGFDRRATTVPPWLSASFKAVSGAVVTSTEKTSADPVAQNVQYQLFEPKDPSAFANHASFDGNDRGTVWSASGVPTAVGDQYLVFVKKTQPSSVNPETKPVTIEACGVQPNATPQSIYDTARNDATTILEQWVGDHAEYRDAYNSGRVALSFQPSDCRKIEGQAVAPPKYPKACGKTDAVNSTQANLVVNAWPRESTAFIDATMSTVTAQARGTTQTVAAGGPISFRIDENSNLLIDEATLFSAPLVVQDLHVENISIGQRGATLASCADNPVPKPYGLCHNYVIPASHTPMFGIGATVDRQYAFTPLANNQAILVTVDHNNYVFKLSGGGIDGEVQTAEGPVAVKLSLDITGRFENFAPVASAKESPKRFECKDANRANVTLDASASYDRDQNPTTLLYKWTEDAGTPAERVLGSQKRVTNVPMNFGGHRITLSVQDNRGVTGTVAFDVDVYDAKIDAYHPPADVYVPIKNERTPVEIGTATGSDGCSGQVRIRNNAPGRMAFPEGFTAIEWVFDDYHGNVLLHRQNVFVVPPRMYPPPVATGHASLEGAQGQSRYVMYIYGTKSQGATVQADEYLLLETPGRNVYTFDETDQLRGPGEIVPHRQTMSFGAGDSTGFLTVTQWDARFPGKGIYTFKHILVRPGASPKDDRAVIAYHRFDLTQGEGQ